MTYDYHPTELPSDPIAQIREQQAARSRENDAAFLLLVASCAVCLAVGALVGMALMALAI